MTRWEEKIGPLEILVESGRILLNLPASPRELVPELVPDLIYALRTAKDFAAEQDAEIRRQR